MQFIVKREFGRCTEAVSSLKLDSYGTGTYILGVEQVEFVCNNSGSHTVCGSW